MIQKNTTAFGLLLVRGQNDNINLALKESVQTLYNAIIFFLRLDNELRQRS